MFIFDCLQNNSCDPFKDYVKKIRRKCTGNSSHSVKQPCVKTKIGKNCVADTGWRILMTCHLMQEQLNQELILFRF